MAVEIAVIGAGSLVGRMLARAWAGRGDVLWLSRAQWQAAEGAGALAALIAEAEAVICLAGVTRDADFALNVEIGRAVAEAAAGRRLLLASSQAVYGPAPGPHPEDGPTAPAGAYGASKLAMERAVAGLSGVTALRLGNVMGADLLGRNLLAGHERGQEQGQRLVLDQFADGRTPRRSYIDPVSLADTLAGLIAHDAALPPVLNVARAPSLEMGALLAAAGAAYETRPAPQEAVPDVAMDCARLFALLPAMAAPLDAADVVARWRSLAP